MAGVPRSDSEAARSTSDSLQPYSRLCARERRLRAQIPPILLAGCRIRMAYRAGCMCCCLLGRRWSERDQRNGSVLVQKCQRWLIRQETAAQHGSCHSIGQPPPLHDLAHQAQGSQCTRKVLAEAGVSGVPPCWSRNANGGSYGNRWLPSTDPAIALASNRLRMLPRIKRRGPSALGRHRLKQVSAGGRCGGLAVPSVAHTARDGCPAQILPFHWPTTAST